MIQSAAASKGSSPPSMTTAGFEACVWSWGFWCVSFVMLVVWWIVCGGWNTKEEGCTSVMKITAGSGSGRAVPWMPELSKVQIARRIVDGCIACFEVLFSWEDREWQETRDWQVNQGIFEGVRLFAVCCSLLSCFGEREERLLLIDKVKAFVVQLQGLCIGASSVRLLWSIRLLWSGRGLSQVLVRRGGEWCSCLWMWMQAYYARKHVFGAVAKVDKIIIARKRIKLSTDEVGRVM